MRRFVTLAAFLLVVVALPSPGYAQAKPTCRPVVLLHGTLASTESTWPAFTKYLERLGFCTYPLNYGDLGDGYGMAPIESSAYELSDHIDKVLEVTGAEKVSIVGHDQGGVMPRWYLRFLDGAAKVDELIALGPANHGVDRPLGEVVCPACADQLPGSAVLTTLNRGGEVESDVDYTTIYSRFDEVTGSALTGSPRHVANIELQRSCPTNRAGHADLPRDPVAWQWVVHALSWPGPASSRYRPLCL